jgi:cation diffusion facilitator family transporter
MNADEAPHFAERRQAMLVSLLVGLGMLGGKWAAYFLTGSSAIFSDALESVVHGAATAFAYAGVLITARPPDEKYPYGYGKISYFSAGFEGGLIVLAAIAIAYAAILDLVRKDVIKQPGAGLAIIGLAFVINALLGLWLIHKGRKTSSLILVADGQHVFSDCLTSLGVVVGVALVWLTGWWWLDPVVAILVALNIVRIGYQLTHEAFAGLMGRADPELLEEIVRALEMARRPGWIDIHELRAWRAGDRVFVEFHLVVPPGWTVEQAHAANDRCLQSLRSTLGEGTQMIIHFDPDRRIKKGDDTRDCSPWSISSAVRVPAPGTLGAEASALGPTNES